MSSNVRRRRRTIEERLGAAVRHLRPGDLAGRGEPLPRDRGATRVSGGGPGEDGDRGAHTEHVTLEASASQTIASGGAGMSWGQIVGPPTERRGFETLSARIAADGSVVAIPIDVTGLCQLILELQFYDATTGAALDETGVDCTVTVTRRRAGLTADWPNPLADTDLVGVEGDVTGFVRSDDTLAVMLGPSVDIIVGGRIYVDVWADAAPTSPGPWQQVLAADVWGLHFDGTYWWTTEGQDGETLTQWDADWVEVATFEADMSADRLRGVTHDGTYLWLTGGDPQAAPTGDYVHRHQTDNTHVSQFLNDDDSTNGLAWDGTHVWVVAGNAAELRRYDTAGTLVDTITLAGTSGIYLGLAHYNGRLYVVDSTGAIEVYDTAGTLVDTIDVTGATSNPTGAFVATDGTLYVAEDGVGVWRRRVS